MYTHVLCVQACAYEHGGLRRQASSDLLELEIRLYKLLEAGARSHSENQTPVLRKNNVRSSPLSILPSPWKEFLCWWRFNDDKNGLLSPHSFNPEHISFEGTP